MSGRGFTLLELVIALAIVAVLASIATPAYRGYILRANRSDGRAALLALAAAQEKFYLQCNVYTAILDVAHENTCSPPSLRFATTSERGYYMLEVTGADASAWTATATAVSGTPQARDRACWMLRLDSTGARTSSASDGAPGEASCWTK